MPRAVALAALLAAAAAAVASAAPLRTPGRGRERAGDVASARLGLCDFIYKQASNDADAGAAVGRANVASISWAGRDLHCGRVDDCNLLGGRWRARLEDWTRQRRAG